MSRIAYKLKAYTSFFFARDKFANAFIVYMAALASFAALPFFPTVSVPFLALLPAYFAYSKKPEYGIVLLALMNVLPAMYQSTAFGFIYLLAFSIILFKVWTSWKEIAFLHLIIFLPFAAFPFSMLSGFIYLVFLIGALHLGSYRSVALSVPAVLLIMLLSSLWQVENPYVPISLYKYKVTDVLHRAEVPSLVDFFTDAIPNAFTNMVSFSHLFVAGDAFDIVFNNLGVALFEDAGALQIAFWALLLYLIPFLTGFSRKRSSELFAGLLLFAVFPYYYVLYTILQQPMPLEIFIYPLLSYGVFYYLHSQGFTFTHEKIERSKRRSKVFAELGLEDLSAESNVRGLEDVANYEDVKEELFQAIKIPLEKPELAYTYGLKPPKGILLFGPPGTGKSYLMQAFARELNYPLLYIKTSDILSPYYGESEKKLSQIFELARKKAPAILFFDEIDAIGKKRGLGMDDVTPRILNTLLQELDGIVSKEPIIFVAATNVPNLLDPALLRPGRIDKVIYMGLPDAEGREAIFKYYLKDLPTEGIDYKKLAKNTSRFTPADIANVVREAKREAAKKMARLGKVVPITMDELLAVISSTKPSVSLSMLDTYEKFKLEFERRTGKAERKPEGKVITFKDVADMEDVKKALKEAIELPLKHPELLEKFEVSPPKGLLLFGPPGTGKTYIVKAAAGEFSVPLIFLSGAELLKKGFGGAAEVLKEAFNRAKDNAPSIVFIDEIETVAPARTGGANPLMGQLLQELDGLKELKNVLVIGATNLPQSLDPALLRPGRFDRIIYIPPPSEEVRKEIFKIHLGKFASLFDIDALAKETEGFSAADIKAVADEVKIEMLRAAAEGKKPEQVAEEAMKKVLEGRKPSITKSLLKIYERFMEEYGERR